MAAMLRELRLALRYGAASGVALLLDVMTFLGLIDRGLAPALAAALGYALGLGVHYLLSRALVFGSSRVGIERLREAGSFVLTGLAGLAMTASLVHLLAVGAALPVWLAKSVATGVSFVALYAMRRAAIFRTVAP